MRRPLRVLGVAAQLDSQGITRVPLRWFTSRCLYSARLYALERIANLFVRVDKKSLRRFDEKSSDKYQTTRLCVGCYPLNAFVADRK